MLNSLQNASFNRPAVKFGSAAAVKTDKKFAADGNFTKEEKAVSATAVGLTAAGLIMMYINRGKGKKDPSPSQTAEIIKQSIVNTVVKPAKEMIESTILRNESKARKDELLKMREDAAAVFEGAVEADPKGLTLMEKAVKKGQEILNMHERKSKVKQLKAQVLARKAAREAAGETNTAKMERIANEKIAAQRAAFDAAPRSEQLAMMKQDAAVAYGGKVEAETKAHVPKTQKDLRRAQVLERKAAREAAGETNTAKMERIANEKIAAQKA